MIKFLQNRKTAKEQPTCIEDKCVTPISDTTIKDTITEGNNMDGTKWLNMDKIEEDKLEWMKDIVMDNSKQQEVSSIAKFD